MNNDIFKGQWHKIKGKVKEKWGKLTDDELMRIDGKREQLLGALQHKYGWDKNRAEQELHHFERSCNCDSKSCNSEGRHPEKNKWDQGERREKDDDERPRRRLG